MRRSTILMAGFLLSLNFAAPDRVRAQEKVPVTRDDYGRWERLSFGGRFGGGGLSEDGRWLVYGINRVDGESELRLIPSGGGEATVIPYASRPAFSSGDRWLAVSIGHSEAEQEELRSAQRPVQNDLGLVDLRDRSLTRIEGVRAFAFSADGAWVAMHRYAPPALARSGGAPGGGRGGAQGGGAQEAATGTTLIVRHLADGRETSFGNIADFAWQDAERAHLLAMSVGASGRLGNGIQLFDPDSSVIRVLDSAAADYTGLSWREDSADLVVLRAEADTLHSEPTHTVLLWSGVGQRSQGLHALRPLEGASIPMGMRIAPFGTPSWNRRGDVLFVGLASWELKPQPEGRGARGRGGRESGAGAPPVEPADVDIWHPDDVVVMARQKLSASGDRRRTLPAAWHIESGRLTPLTDDPVNTRVITVPDRDYAVVEEWSAYAMERSIGRPAADLYRVDLRTGDRTPLVGGINDRYVQVSPGGRYLLFLRDDHYFTIDLPSGQVRDITSGVPTSFIDTDSDAAVQQKPPFGTGGWTKDDASVLLHDRFDIWSVAADGSGGLKLTDGAADQVRMRRVDLDPDADWVDLSGPVYVSLFGERSKMSGYGRLLPRGRGVTRMIWLEEAVSGLSKATGADVFAYLVQDYDDSPDVFVTGADLRGGHQVTSTNAFQMEFAWGRSEVVSYESRSGKPLQGALYYPADYQAGRRYPMIVYIYETLSDNVHRFVAPSEREYYNTSVFTTQGFFVLQPDIIFEPREPGVSVVDCVVPAVEAVIASGVADPARVGVIGHSWGGFDTSFLATHTNGVFAAAVAGAPITNLVSNYGNHHWNSGIAETDHIETGQQRMEVPLYEDLDAYIRNSAVFNVQNMSTPLLVEVGDEDGTVFWHQGVELYNIARRARKNVVMLVYNGEDHGLRQEKNQVDYQRRILQWFGHYLKGEEPESWITEGVSYLDRQAELERLGGGGGG